MTTKKCSRCQQLKPRDDFYQSAGRIYSHCKPCKAEVSQDPEVKKRRAAYTQKYRSNNKDKIKAAQQKCYETNPELYRQRKSEYYQKYRESTRNSALQSNYGITQKDYERMFEEQGGACKICGSTDSKNSRTKNLAVDHCHATGKVRGLLCHSCNRGLGYLQDSTAVIERALVYLRGVV